MATSDGASETSTLLTKCSATDQAFDALQADQLNENVQVYCNSEGSVKLAQKLIKIHHFKEFSAGEWEKIMQHLSSWFEGILETTRFLESLSDTIGFVQCLQSVKESEQTEDFVSASGLHSICIVLDFVFRACLQVLRTYSKMSAKDDVNAYFDGAFTLYDLGLNILSAALANKVLNTCEEFSSLASLTLHLCAIGRQKAAIKLKYLIETTKRLVDVTSRCIQWYSSSNRQSPPSYQWAKKPLEFLIVRIEWSLQNLSEEKTLSMPIEHVDRFLRVTNFYIKLLKRLAFLMPHQTFPAALKFLGMWLESQRLQHLPLRPDVKELLPKYVYGELVEVFKLCYRHPDMSAELVRQLKRGVDFDACYAVSLEYLRNFVAEALEIKTKRIAAVKDIFEEWFKGSFLFQHPLKFNKLIDCFVGFMFMERSQSLRDYHRSNILKGDLRLAFASAEVLLCFQSWFSDHGAFTLSEFRFWRQHYSAIEVDSRDMRDIVISRLLRNAYELCVASKDIAIKKLLWEDLRETQNDMHKFRLFLAIGLDSLATEQEEALLHLLKNNLTKLISKHELGCLKAEPDIAYMATYIELIASSDIKPSSDLSRPLANLALSLSKNTPQSMLAFDKVLLALCKFYRIRGQPDVASIQALYSSCHKYFKGKNNGDAYHLLSSMKALLKETTQPRAEATQANRRILIDCETFRVWQMLCDKSFPASTEEENIGNCASPKSKRPRLS